MKRVNDVIVKPLLTEKSNGLNEDENTYAFQVGRDATKIEIKQTVERLFGVRVKQVRTMVVRGKMKRFGRYFGKRPNWKKAYITVEGDGVINVYGAA